MRLPLDRDLTTATSARRVRSLIKLRFRFFFFFFVGNGGFVLASLGLLRFLFSSYLGSQDLLLVVLVEALLDLLRSV